MASAHATDSSGTGPLLQEPRVKLPHGSLTGERSLHRIFIGPMPERIISQAESQNQKKQMTLGSMFSLTMNNDRASSPADRAEEVAHLVKTHALRFFLHEGGDEDQWDTRQEESTVEELVQRWKNSEWGRLWQRRNERHRKREPGFRSASTPQWFGASFEIGNILGVNVLTEQMHAHDKGLHSSIRIPPSTEDSNRSLRPPVSPISANDESPSGRRSFSLVRGTSYKTSQYETARTTMVTTADEVGSGYYFTPTSSQTRLLEPSSSDMPQGPERNLKAESQPNLPLSTTPRKNVLRSQTDTPTRPISKSKGKMVHYDLAQIGNSVSETSSIDGPAPPERVLQRQMSSLPANTSSAAASVALAEAEAERAAKTQLPGESEHDDIVLKDRMLVRVSYSKQEHIIRFDEAMNRTAHNLKYEDWGEFLVAWRKDNIEIYRDHNTLGKEWFTGHKHLLYVIPLLSLKTKLSLYSFVDMTFCITSSPTAASLNSEKSRWHLSREKEGTHVFIFKVKSRSRAYDWIWKLWRFMGGQLPPTLDIYNPRLDARVTIDIPETKAKDDDDIYPAFSRRNIIDTCTNSLVNVPDWKFLMDEQIKIGHSLELAWRHAAILDWIWLEKDVDGKQRQWHVLCGLALRQLAGKPPSLEIRIAPHEPADLRLKSGELLEEPPSIEGYLDRIRPNTQTKQSIYISVHSGYLYLLHSLSAFPPTPPGLNDFGAENIDGQIRKLRQSEIHRGVNQIAHSMSTLDLRAIVAVRRASHPSAPHTHDVRAQHDEDPMSNFTHNEPAIIEDEEDAGGEEGLSGAHNRAEMRMRRSFELLLKSGHVYRFETHSCRVTIEWITRLRALIHYWKQRHRIEAKQEIELAQAQKPRLTPLTRTHCNDHDEFESSDLSSPFEAMNSLYNWCVLEGCRPAVKRGRLYMRRGLRGQYKLVQLCLVAGHLIRFRISGSSPLYPAMRKKFNLVDAYLYSGYLAEQCLPKGQYNPNATPPPRRYQDGLETDDREEDMVFMIWYRPQPAMLDAEKNPTSAPVVTKSTHTLSAKNKVLIFKTRSIFERDTWCYAINAEIEKIARMQKDRENALRNAGNLVSLTG